MTVITMFQSKQPRDIDTIRRAIATSAQRKLAKSLSARHEEIMERKRDLVLPSKRRSIVEWFFAAKIEDLAGQNRELAEAVAIAHVPSKVVSFDGLLDQRVGEIDREVDALQRQHNTELAVALEIEADAFRDLVRPSYQAQGVEHELEDAPPLRELKRAVARAREFVAGPYLGWNGAAVGQTLRHFI